MYEVDLSRCDCCGGISVETPVRISNLPGLSAIAYRVGTYTKFQHSMQTRLADADLSGLNALKTRQPDDFTIALLDSWSMVCEVLTFYQERIANESYKRTATERTSLLELARLVRYKLQPGVAADAYLVYTLDETPGSPGQAIINIGTQAQSLPGPGEKPQVFETTEMIVAKAQWNAIRPVATKIQPIFSSTKDIWVKGTNTKLATGDMVLIVDNSTSPMDPLLLRVQNVAVDTAAGQSHIIFEGYTSTHAAAFTQPTIFALRQRASLFGHNAPDWKLMPKVIQDNYNKAHGISNPPEGDWPYSPAGVQQLDLDRVYSQILPNDWIAVELPGTPTPPAQIVQVSQAQETTVSDYGLNLKITHLELSKPITQPQSMSDLRKVTVFLPGEQLHLVEIPETQPIQKDTIIVNDVLNGLYAGRRMVVTGITDSLTSGSTTEIVLLDHTQPLKDNRTALYLRNGGLLNSYIPSSVTINANVVAATQGESVSNEILGSGDATQPFQSFTLRQSPLTYVQASTQDGKASTLQVFVNDIQWSEVDAFYGHGPLERIFITLIGDDGKVTVKFGDGRTGARLPTGEDNVTASYRTGTGSNGLVKPGQISLLKTLPLGVKGVSNPLMPTGAIDRDTIDDARRNADTTVRTLGRIVSGSDYEDFARSYAAVDKARATIIWNNTTKSVYVTIAGPATLDKPFGTEIVQDSGLYKKIYTGMRKASDLTISFFLQSYIAQTFRLAARIRVHSDYAPEDVLKAVELEVLSRFSFHARGFSQAVILKEVIAATQEVPGVVTARVYAFYRTDSPPPIEPDPDIRLDENLSLVAALPNAQNDGTVSLAELLIVDPNQPFASLEVMS
jgi:predicted phage baseplate assembly protein